MSCGIHGRSLVNSFSLVWFELGRSLITANLCRPLSMLPEPSLSKATNTRKNSTYLANFNFFVEFFTAQHFAIRYAP